jgi:hypothetical protein
VASDTAIVTVGFAANTNTSAKTYTVSVADTSANIKGNATVTINQAAPGSITQDSIAITFWVNEDEQLLASNSSVTISRSSNGYSASFTGEVSGSYDSVTWLVNGVLKSEARTATINAADYRNGTYRLGVIITKGNAPYSTEIIFTVRD